VLAMGKALLEEDIYPARAKGPKEPGSLSEQSAAVIETIPVGTLVYLSTGTV